jgi:hypothetical protein
MNRIVARGITLAVFAALLAAPAALAQEVAPPQPEIVTDFDEAELDAFASAYLDIEGLQIHYQTEYGDVDDPEQVQQLQLQFQHEAAEILDDAGITVEKYEQIIIAAQADEQFAEDLIARIEALRIQRAG